MKFGACAVTDTVGAILAHSIVAGDVKLRKGRVLSLADVDVLQNAGITQVVVAQLSDQDVSEDAAAAMIALGLGDTGITVSAPFTGRANLFADCPGLVEVDTGGVATLNSVDEGISLATLPNFARVDARSMIATVKIIPYGVARNSVDAVCVDHPIITLHRFIPQSVDLILTRTPGMRDSLITKGRAAVQSRLSRLGLILEKDSVVAHQTDAIAHAISTSTADIVLILGASATSDRADVGPAALCVAGGAVTRFGMPVDPGNLLFIGDIQGRPVVGLPGCVRSPALNGADWILERLAARLPISNDMIAGMGVGGLLKEIPTRPQSRSGTTPAQRAKIAVLVLAAGAGQRMRGVDKLTERVESQPLLQLVTTRALSSKADVVLVALPPDHTGRHDALIDLPVQHVIVPDPSEGMAASIRAGISALSPDIDAVVIVLADMPQVSSADIDRLIAAFDPGEQREIVRATTSNGRPGHPILFGRRFFETLGKLNGDTGARDVIAQSTEFVTDVAMAGDGPIIDLDTPEAWAAWRAKFS